jgi:hypothetical protein
VLRKGEVRTPPQSTTVQQASIAYSFIDPTQHKIRTQDTIIYKFFYSFYHINPHPKMHSYEVESNSP